LTLSTNSSRLKVKLPPSPKKNYPKHPVHKMGKFTQNVYGTKWVKVLYCLILLRLMRLIGLKITYRGVIAEGFWDGVEER
jgi:hypothetical protein